MDTGVRRRRGCTQEYVGGDGKTRTGVSHDVGDRARSHEVLAAKVATGMVVAAISDDKTMLDGQEVSARVPTDRRPRYARPRSFTVVHPAQISLHFLHDFCGESRPGRPSARSRRRAGAVDRWR